MLYWELRVSSLYIRLRLVERNRKESAYAGIIEQCLCAQSQRFYRASLGA